MTRHPAVDRGRLASYAVGSDVNGPMGHELIPFAERSHAETFLQDHHGREILSFSAIRRSESLPNNSIC